MLYHCYNLAIKSEIELPEIFPLNQNGRKPDVDIRVGKVASDGLKNGDQIGPFLWVSPDALWLQVPDVARFLVEDGNRITIDPASGIDEDSVRVFLLGSAFGALLFQRGLLVLHGNAVKIGDKCVVCVGVNVVEISP